MKSVWRIFLVMVACVLLVGALYVGMAKAEDTPIDQAFFQDFQEAGNTLESNYVWEKYLKAWKAEAIYAGSMVKGKFPYPKDQQFVDEYLKAYEQASNAAAALERLNWSDGSQPPEKRMIGTGAASAGMAMKAELYKEATLHLIQIYQGPSGDGEYTYHYTGKGAELAKVKEQHRLLNSPPLSYQERKNWAYVGSEQAEIQPVDVFFVGPTVFLGTDSQANLPIEDAKLLQTFTGAVNMEKGLYDGSGNFYAPYYRQAALSVYKMEAGEAVPYFDLAYRDVKAAFTYYLKEYNRGRPIVLAGFSQGGDMVLRLMKDVFKDPALQQRLVAAYIIGWRITPEELTAYPQLKMAQGERDTGVIVSFNTEAPQVTHSVPVPMYTLGINPLNWKTTSEQADRSLHRGAVFTNYDGKVTKEIQHFTGAYLDEKRGTLKVTDVTAAEYPPVLDLFEPGVFHIYDYLFFYRNLQDNVKNRVEAYVEKHK